MKPILNYIKGNTIYFVFALFFAVAAAITRLIQPQIIQHTLDTIIGKEPASYHWIDYLIGNSLGLAAILIILFTIIDGVFIFLRAFLAGIGTENVAEKLRNKLYRHTQYLTFERLSTLETGDTIQRCTSDIDTVTRFLGAQLPEVVRAVAMIVYSSVMMLMLSPMLAIIPILTGIMILAFSGLLFSKIKNLFMDSEEAEGSLTNFVQENLSGVRVVRAFGRENYEIDGFEVKNLDMRNKGIRLLKSMSKIFVFNDTLSLINGASTLIFGAYLVVTDSISLGVFVAFITYAQMLNWPVKQLGRILGDVGKAMIASKRIEEVLEYESEDITGPVSEINGKLEFKNVSFTYSDGKKALDNLNFTLEAGKSVGIIGATGSGKSTLVQIIQRLHDYEGSVLLDGVELRTLGKANIRKHIGLVLQEPYLYSKNIRENIRITNPKFSDEDVEKAASLASIHQNILSLKEKYETVVGEKGVSLSGGQKQRIAIARTIIDPTKKILIFDDSLSAVDSETDLAIRESIQTRSKDISLILISHRLDTVQNCDNIIVLKEGSIAESGTHEQLMEKGGIYSRLYLLQTQEVS